MSAYQLGKPLVFIELPCSDCLSTRQALDISRRTADRVGSQHNGPQIVLNGIAGEPSPPWQRKL